MSVNTPSPRGSWSGLFNSGSVRQLMAAAHNSPDASSPAVTDGSLSGRLPVPGTTRPKEPSRALSQSPLKRGVAKSWSESSSRLQRNLSITGTRGPTLSGSPSMEKVEKPLNNKKLMVVLARDNKRYETTGLYLLAELIRSNSKHPTELHWRGMARADGDARQRIR